MAKKRKTSVSSVTNKRMKRQKPRSFFPTFPWVWFAWAELRLGPCAIPIVPFDELVPHRSPLTKLLMSKRERASPDRNLARENQDANEMQFLDSFFSLIIVQLYIPVMMELFFLSTRSSLTSPIWRSKDVLAFSAATRLSISMSICRL